MKVRKENILTLLFSMLLLQACANNQSSIATSIAQTVEVSALETAAAQPAGAQTAQPRSEATSTQTSEVTPTQTLTPTPALDWTGTWQMHMQLADNGEMVLYKSGNSIMGDLRVVSGVGSTYQYTITGTISADGQTIVGEYDYLGTKAGFTWHMEPGSPNQFRGSSISPSFEWCGQRFDAPLPVPCIWP